MKVGILGSGDVGQALGTGFAERGHEVVIGSRSPDSAKLRAWARKAGPRACASSFADAAKGDLLVLACLGSAVDDVIQAAGPKSFAGKVVIDATNPLDFRSGSVELFVGLQDSLGERVQKRIPKAKVVKAFNTIPSVLMVDPKLRGGKPTMLICGNDVKAKGRVTAILKEFGWSGAIDLGRIDASRWMEALVPLWLRVGRSIGTWKQIFQVVEA